MDEDVLYFDCQESWNTYADDTDVKEVYFMCQQTHSVNCMQR